MDALNDATETYDYGDVSDVPSLDAIAYARSAFVSGLAGSHFVPRWMRRALLRRTGMEIAEDVKIGPGFQLIGKHLAVGRGSSLNAGVLIDATAQVDIGRKCFFGPQVAILTTTHKIGDWTCRTGEPIYLPVHIGEGCWIGARTTILPGVKVGSGCVIAAGSMVTSDCDPNGLYAGVPAVRKRDLL